MEQVVKEFGRETLRVVDVRNPSPRRDRSLSPTPHLRKLRGAAYPPDLRAGARQVVRGRRNEWRCSGGGRVGVIDDFGKVVTTVGGKIWRSRGLRQDKGHRWEIERFAQVITRSGEAPFSWREFRAVSLAAILAVRSLREGLPFDVPPDG